MAVWFPDSICCAGDSFVTCTQNILYKALGSFTRVVRRVLRKVYVGLSLQEVFT